MPTVTDLLERANIQYESFKPAKSKPVYLTLANQLIGTFKVLSLYRAGDSNYAGWQAHHVVEKQDLDRLHLTHLSPSSDDQLCVLLPERAHIGRINSILRSRIPMGSHIDARMMLDAYGEAYALMGDYCGGGEQLIRRELLEIVKTTLKNFKLI